MSDVPADSQFNPVRFTLSEVEHRYGERVHILADPLSLTLLARLGHPDTVQPEMGILLRHCYEYLLQAVVGVEFPRRQVTMDTRMKRHTPRGQWTGQVVDTTAPVAIIALARAGLIPSQVCFERLCEFMDRGVVRQDHLAAERSVSEGGEVTGTVIASAKIGGAIDGAYLLVPDPMGATGSTVLELLKYYRSAAPGEPAKVIFMHLMVTPEYLRRVSTDLPDAHVYALRVDRGLSEPEVLRTVPGERWDDERGLTDAGYIVPGAGGVGEALNNTSS